jgi:hypothetical protein
MVRSGIISGNNHRTSSSAINPGFGFFLLKSGKERTTLGDSHKQGTDPIQINQVVYNLVNFRSNYKIFNTVDKRKFLSS